MSKPGSKPYKWIFMPEHPKSTKKGWIQEHRVVAEQIVGRILKPEEVVHHIDENTTNNNVNNLMVFATSNDHAAYHGGREIYEIDSVWYALPKEHKPKQCEICGKIFIPKWESTQRFCCKRCQNKSQIRITTESLRELQELLIDNGGNFLETARQLNVTGNAIVRRLKRAGLPYHSSDYKLCF